MKFVGFCYQPVHVVLYPLQVPLAWQVLLEDPPKRNPGSHVKRFVFGNTVRSPDDDPFNGTPRNPQSIAWRKEQQMTGMKKFLLCFLNREQVFEMYFCIIEPHSHFLSPSQEVSSPLQVLFAWHCLITEPIRIKPSSQLKVTLFG